MIEFSIIIVHHRTPEMLKLCLKYIKEVVLNMAYEVIVIDSAAQRSAADLIKYEYPEFRYFPFQENIGFARGVNIGIKQARGQYFLIMNPDVVLTNTAVLEILALIKKHSDIGLVGPKVLNFNGTRQNTIFGLYRPLTILARRSFLGSLPYFKKFISEFLLDGNNFEKLQTPDWIMGSALMTSRKAVEKIGPMDERFFMYFEDVDWARRFWHNGFKVVYCPRAVVYHYHQRESKSKLGILDAIFNRKTRWHIKSAVKFFWKYRDLRKVFNE